MPNSIVCIYRHFLGRPNVTRLTPLPPKRQIEVILEKIVWRRPLTLPDLFEETSLPNQGQLSVNPSRKFTVLSNCAYCPGVKPGKKHALNNQYAPNGELLLLTRVYGIMFCVRSNNSSCIQYILCSLRQSNCINLAMTY